MTASGPSTPDTVTIRPATAADRPALWRILEPIFRAGETYPQPRDMSEADALAYWLAPAHEVFVAVGRGEIVGTYYLKANQPGGGAHVANCGYAVREDAAGRGLARAMWKHSHARALERGFRAMQFNFVVSTNTRAAALWQACGFEIVGRLPGAFAHPLHGDVDAYVMFRRL
ncbi:MAG TPA: N-acetyltransferase [Xanthobacteraceae bacterium]|nr:N-acetyltransferase [Xanthobacteraceae bacterium]